MDNWKGFKEWTFEWFTQKYGDVNVDVHSTTQKSHKMLLKDYLNSFKIEKSEKEALYLSNWVFGTDHPELLNYFETPKYFTEDWMKLIKGHPDLRWLYIGPKNTFSLLHIDVLSTSAWLAQFQGKVREFVF
jgi:histone arginine demethylase JMJD6